MAVPLNQVIDFCTMAGWRLVAPTAFEFFLVGARCVQFHCDLGEILRDGSKPIPLANRDECAEGLFKCSKFASLRFIISIYKVDQAEVTRIDRNLVKESGVTYSRSQPVRFIQVEAVTIYFKRQKLKTSPNSQHLFP